MGKQMANLVPCSNVSIKHRAGLTESSGTVHLSANWKIPYLCVHCYSLCWGYSAYWWSFDFTV